MEKIIVPDSVTSIGHGAFSYCYHLTEASLPSADLEYGVFDNCSQLTSVTLSDGITRLPSSTFRGCGNLTKIKLPDSLTYIGERVFYECINLEEIIIPDSVTIIDGQAFYKCTNLKKITIPTSVTAIHSQAFDYCKNLQDVYYKGTMDEWNNITINDNSYLKNATIHYNASNATVSAQTHPHPPVVDSVSSVRAQSAGISITADTQTESFSDLQPDTLYNFYCKKSEPEALNSESLLYIGQYRSDANGNLQVTYTPKEACENVEIFIVSQSQMQLIASGEENNSVEITNLQRGETLNLNKENLISSNEDTASVNSAGLVTALNTGTTVIFSVENGTTELIGIINVSGETTFPLGDVNQDGKINASDAAAILVEAARAGAGSEKSFTAEQKFSADVNKDDKVNASDAAVVLIYAAEIGAGSFKGTMEEYVNFSEK